MSLAAGRLELGALELFLSVVEEGSISRAATACGVAQPSASARLHHLEHVLGLRLLERTPRGTVPTQEGLVVAEWARALLAAARDFSAGIDGLRQPSEGRLRLVASYTIAEYLLPRWLAAFHAKQPHMAVELVVANSTEVPRFVRDSQADLGFTESGAPPIGFRWQEVGRDELVLVVPASHRWSRVEKPVTPEDLAGEPLVVREPGSGTRDVFESALRMVFSGPVVAPALELGSTAAVKAAVLGGAGPTVVSRLAIEHEVEEGQLVVVPTEGLPLGRTLCAVWGRDQPLSHAAHDLLVQIRTSQ
ncbi:MAG: LysR family transcriptional regulator [Ilumatobacteraceae bacterium]